jgi:hypothetical protein
VPISLELANFTAAFRTYHVKKIAESFERLGKWLTKRVKQADDLDRATSHIPVVWFYNEAVTLWIDESQEDALAPKEPPPSFGDRLRSGGRRFVAGLKDFTTLREESLIIPRFFDSLLDAAKIIDKSVERFKEPGKWMFDTEARTASDLFGQAALTWRALYWSREQIGEFVQILGVLKGPSKPGGGGGPVESAYALPDMFERVTRYIVAGLYLIPLLPEFVKRVWKEASIFIRGKVLEEFAGIEQQVFGVRRMVIDLFYVDLRNSLRKGLALASVWSFILTAWVSLFLDLSKRFGQQVLDQLAGYFSKLSVFMDKLVDVFRGLMKLLEELVKIDLMPLLIKKLGWKGDLVSKLASPPSITLGDLADEKSRTAANDRMQKWLSKVRNRLSGLAATLGGLLGGGATAAIIESMLKQVRKVLNIALKTKTEEVEETGAFAGPLPAFPDISETFTATLEPLRESLLGFIPTLKAETMGVIDKGVEALDAISKHFDRAAASALRGPSVEKYLAISSSAEKMAEKLMPSSDVEGGEANAVIGAIARSWENWFVRGEQGARAGFSLIGAIIPEYIKAMREYWAERQARGEEATVRLPEDLPKDFPTSPHIMALKPVLSRTLAPRVTVNATGHTLDEKLLERIADAVRDRVQEAHRRGLAKLEAIQAAATGIEV